MKAERYHTIRAFALWMLMLCLPSAVLAGPRTQAGPYLIELTAREGVLPTTGRAKLMYRVTDGSGKPVAGVTLRSLTQMPGMNMGEREEVAAPVPGQPGVYTAPASFAMEGGYEDTLKVDGPLGSVTAKIALSTGQNTAASAGSPSAGTGSDLPGSLLPWIGAVLIGAFVLARMRRKGRISPGESIRAIRSGANRAVIGGLAMLGLILWGAIYSVNHFRRPGAYTPLQAQGMEMNLPAPVGTAPVELATVESGSMTNTVRYTGQAVGYVEQDVTPRVTGVILWMPFYAGDRVARGQLLARLDTSQSAPQVAAQRGQVAMAQQGVEVSKKDYQQVLAMVTEAHSEVGTIDGALAAARADVSVAEQEHASAQANQDAAESMIADSDAQLQAAQADQRYWREEIDREASLLKDGAVTREEYQREQDQAQNADAKVRQAQARIAQTQAQIRAAEAEAQKALATIASAKAKVQQVQAELGAHESHVRSAQAAKDSARQKILQAEAGVQQARGALAGTVATQGYSEIRAETSGVITQRLISPGVLVSPGQPLLKIAQIAPIRLQASVAEPDLQKVRVGSRVLVRMSNATFTPIVARITSIAPSIDPGARTGLVEAVVPNTESRFLPGQYVTMEISTGHAEHSLYVPTRALRFHTAPSGKAVSLDMQAAVWVAEPVPASGNSAENGSGNGAENGQEGQYTVHEVTVKTGMSDTSRTEILSGLKAGQRVVTAGQDALKEGDTVSPVPPQIAGGTQ